MHSGVVCFAVGELHSHSPLVGHDVRVGDDEAVAADDEARAIGHGDLSACERVTVEQHGRISDNGAMSDFKWDWVVSSL